jgi:hypothetical protein
MVSDELFNIYIAGFFMNFELLPIMQIRKKRGGVKLNKNLLLWNY